MAHYIIDICKWFICAILSNLYFQIVGIRILCFLDLFIYFYREGKGGRKRGRETSMFLLHDVSLAMFLVASCMPPTGALACNPGMRPDWELNHQPFASKASTQSIQPHQPELEFYIMCLFNLLF